MDEKIYWIWLSRIRGIGSRKLNRLLENYKTLKNIWNASIEDLMKIKGIGVKTAKLLLDKKYRLNLDKYIKYMTENKIDIIAINDINYPKQLKQIYDPPIAIYVKGNIEILNNCFIGIVGGRNCSIYGKRISMELSEYLSENGINIVSGLARGIDTYSHIGCIKGKSATVAVLGSGLNEIYPKENTNLAKEIINNGGAIISEYTLGIKPDRLNFPARNRIISGLSNKIVVIEAGKNSGSIITADYALEQGKDIFVVPGNIDSKNSEGSNELIKEGANIITKYDDLIY